MSSRATPPRLLRALFSGRDTDDSRLQAVIEQMPVAALLAAQKSGALIALNSKATALTGWSRAELQRLAIAEVVAAPAASAALEEIHHIEPGQPRQILDVALATRAGRPVMVDLRLAAFAEPAQGDVLVLIQAAPAEERTNQARQTAQGAQALDSFEHLIRLLAEPDDTTVNLAVELIRDMLAADAAALYQVTPDQPAWQLLAATEAPRAFPDRLGPSEAQYLTAPRAGRPASGPTAICSNQPERPAGANCWRTQWGGQASWAQSW